MDLSSSSASTFTRPRISIAIISAAATASIGYFLYEAFRQHREHPSPGPGQRLHRSNAIRRRRAPTIEEAPQERRASNASDYTSGESHGDENVDINAGGPPIHDGETVAGEQMMDDDWFNDPNQMPPQRAGQNIVSLLFRVSEDNARRNAYVHRGCACNACGIVPIRGIRYRCANCADFDLCETCESQGLHVKTHIFYKVKVPAPPFGPRQMQAVWYPGDPDSCVRNLPRLLMAKLSRVTGFERPELEAFWEQWTFMANTEWREDPDELGLAMDRRTFERCLVPSGGYRHTAPNLIHERMFSFYDTNNDDLIGFGEFLQGLSYRKRKDKLKRIFGGYDMDKDGLVSRRDFLRIFRAYYVLYKQMHKDILEGLDDQVMSSTEAHQLVAGRQPLSSLFGREGRVPPADPDRPMEGKVFHSNGDIAIADGKNRVVKEDKPDSQTRDQLLTSLFSSKDEVHNIFAENPFSPTSENPRSPDGETDPRYWSALLNPPSRIEELPGLLVGETRDAAELFVSTGDDEIHEDGDASEDGEGDGSEDAENQANPENANANGDGQPPGEGDSSVQEGEVPPRRATPADRFTNRMPTESQLRLQHQAIRARSRRAFNERRSRVEARRKLHDRWRRRQFYLDEEEGALAPDGWEDNDDILVNLDGVGESSKATHHPPLSPRSRSSSKVRFAEDTDDYEVRSNPSTSSRSVPERWGGMDIPDAERDAGKEILYQVTQQAFNELLDILFKAKEDLAIEAAKTKAIREKHKDLIAAFELDENDEAMLRDAPKGFKVDEDGQTVELSYELPEMEIVQNILDEASALEAGEGGKVPTVDDEACAVNAREDDKAAEGTILSEFCRDVSGVRDPTMPQFRPNSLADSTPEPKATAADQGYDPDETPTKGPAISQAPVKKGRIPGWKLAEWKQLTLAEEEAKARGGWGRLNFEEFEEIYNNEEGQANRLDYLGSWIDFCIP